MGWDGVFLWINSVVVDGKGMEGFHWVGCCSAIDPVEGSFLTTPTGNRQSSAESSKDAHGIALALVNSLNSKSAKMRELSERKLVWLRGTYFIVVVPECIYSIFLYSCGRLAWDSRWACLVHGFNFPTEAETMSLTKAIIQSTDPRKYEADPTHIWPVLSRETRTQGP